jgi:hypothetical protein
MRSAMALSEPTASAGGVLSDRRFATPADAVRSDETTIAYAPAAILHDHLPCSDIFRSDTVNILELPIGQLIPAPYNPRKIPAENSPVYRKLRRSLEAFGLVEPLVWNRTTGHVIGGHLRLRIWKDLGHATAPVNAVELPPEREKALNIILNNREAQSNYDPLKLRDLLEELADLPAFEETGFAPAALKALRLDPLPDFAEDAPGDSVEIVLRTTAEQYQKLETELDAFVRAHGLESHIRRL